MKIYTVSSSSGYPESKIFTDEKEAREHLERVEKEVDWCKHFFKEENIAEKIVSIEDKLDAIIRHLGINY